MEKIKTFLRRLRGMSLKKMWRIVKQVHQDSGRASFVIFLDMIYCAFIYGVGYQDYQVFGFAHIRGKENRKTFMTMNDNLAVVRALNDRDASQIFVDKCRFNRRFSEYIGRGFLDLRECTFEEFDRFLQGKTVVFAKTVDNFGGKGIAKLELSQFIDHKRLHQMMMAGKQYLVEECIEQDERMNSLCASSVNTIRIVTLVKEREVHVMYSLIRIGDGKRFVDNISSDGMYCPVDENGVLSEPAFCDATGEYYEIHPYTGAKLLGFQIPRFHEAVEMVKRAALEVEEVRYVGWDVAISTDGPVLVEGNTIPGYDMCQNYYHLGKDKFGIYPKFKKIMGDLIA